MTHYIGTEFSNMLVDAAYYCECPIDELEMFSWPESFGSTSGPRGGIGGHTITSFQVYAFRETGKAEGFKYCSGVRQKWNGEIQEPWRRK